MGVDILLAIGAVWGTVDYGMPWLIEQQVKSEQPRILTQDEREALELRVEDHLLNNSYRELPRVIVIPIEEVETEKLKDRKQIIIKK